MTRGRLVIGVLAFCITSAAAAIVAAHQQAAFRSKVDVVIVDVAVLDQNRAVTGLTKDDFIVRDNGVVQTVNDVVPSANLPVDLTLILDASSSMSHSVEALRREIEKVAARLAPADEMRLLSIGWDANEIFPMQRPEKGLSFRNLMPGGATALYDTLGSALMRRRRPDRGDLIVLLSDGFDTASALTRSSVLELGKRADALLYVYALRSGYDVAADARRGRPDYRPLAELAEVTGGRLEVVLAENSVVNAIDLALTEFRTRYTLQYTATGVPLPGWHNLSVSLKRQGRYVIRARQGYWGS
jgi:Ca-activated chloride channel family protein